MFRVITVAGILVSAHAGAATPAAERGKKEVHFHLGDTFCPTCCPPLDPCHPAEVAYRMVVPTATTLNIEVENIRLTVTKETKLYQIEKRDGFAPAGMLRAGYPPLHPGYAAPVGYGWEHNYRRGYRHDYGEVYNYSTYRRYPRCDCR